MRFEDVNEKVEIKQDVLPVAGSPFTKPVADIKPSPEPVPSAMNLNILQDNLGHCLNIIEDEVMKGYVIRLDQLPMIRPELYLDQEIKDIHFFKRC